MHKVAQKKNKTKKQDKQKEKLKKKFWERWWGKPKISKFETEPQWEMSVSRTCVNQLQSGTEIKIFD